MLKVLHRFLSTGITLFAVTLVGVSCGNKLSTVEPHDLQIHSSFPVESAVDTSNYLWTPRRFELVDSTVVASDSRRNLSLVYGLDGTFLMTVGEYGQGPGEFINPGPIRRDSITEGIWISSNSRITLLDADLKYVSSFQPPAVVHGFDLLPDGSLVVSITPSNARGSLLRLSRNGEVMWDVSPTLIVDESLPLAGFHCMSDVVTVGSRIWQVFTFFNVIREYTPEGKLVREFPVDHVLPRGRHEWNLQRMAGDRSTGPTSVFMAARASGDLVWLVGTFLEPESNQYPPIHYLALDTTGQVAELFALQNEEIIHTSDVMAFGRRDHRRLLILAVRPPRFLWCEPDYSVSR